MLKILAVVQTPMAMKIRPLLANVLERTHSNAIVVEGNNEPSVEIQRPQTAHPSVLDAPAPATNSTMRNSTIPYFVAPGIDRVSAERQALEAQKLMAERIAHANEFRRQQELEDKEHEAKKLKMDKECDIAINNMQESLEWKEKLEKLDMKYRWANEQGKTQLAERICSLISEL
jgi:hypothetical protein